MQRSSNHSRLVRALTGIGRISSGYSTVNGLRKSVRMVTIIPLAIPVPNKAPPSRMLSSLQGEFYTLRLLYYKGLVKEITGAAISPIGIAIRCPQTGQAP